jgi:hypothetical protein
VLAEHLLDVLQRVLLLLLLLLPMLLRQRVCTGQHVRHSGARQLDAARARHHVVPAALRQQGDGLPPARRDCCLANIGRQAVLPSRGQAAAACAPVMAALLAAPAC